MDLVIKIKKHQQKTWLCAKPIGDLDMAVADEFRLRISDALKSFGCRYLWCDFSDVSFIDSAGLGALLGRYRELAPLNGKVIITGASPHIYRLLQAAGMHKLLEIDKPLELIDRREESV